MGDRWLKGRTYRFIRNTTNTLGRHFWPRYLRLRGISFPTPAVAQVDGITLAVRPHSFDAYIVGEVFRRRIYAPLALPEHAVIVDVGAHIGTFSIWAAGQNPTCRVLACEPFAETYALLQENCRMNGMEGRVTTVQCAVTDQDGGQVSLKLDPTNTGGHSVYAPFHSAGVPVPSVTLSRLLQEHALSRVDLLKIDAEGAEFPILFSTPHEILERISRITLEFHDRFYEHYRAEDLQAHLEVHGYRVRLVPSFLRGPLRPSGMLYAQRG